MSTTPPSDSHSRFIRIARWCAHHRWQTFAGWVLLVVAVSVLGSAVGTAKIDDFRLPGTESQRAYDVLAEHSPQQNGLVDQLVYVARDGTLKDGALRARLDRSRERVLKDPVVVNVAEPRLTPDGRIGVVDITYQEDFEALDPDDFQRVQDAAFTARGAGLQVEHGGQGAQFARFGAQEQGATESAGFFAAFFVLLVMFGSLIAAGIPLLTAAFAIGATFGLVPLISQVVDTPDFAGQLAALIGIGVGIDYALIVVTRYRAEHARGLDREAALLLAMDTAGRTVFFAGCTVIIALLGLL
ncbi:MAG: MMPL family transporter, partial [Solirubrobacteraceae bacterium]|nr:MMPL family transporter [Solirubrobacteraceae bacterium]